MVRHWLGSRHSRSAGLCALAAISLLLAGCADSKKSRSGVDPKYGVRASPRVIPLGQPIPKGGGAYRVGKPYVVAGKTYYPQENRRYRAEGIASWYGEDFHGRLTANGEIYDMHAISAAHPTLPMPSYARVTNIRNGRSIIVRVNDRGPYHDDRVIDLSSRAADLLQVRRLGTGSVRVEYVGPAPLEGSDDRRLLATLTDRGPAPPPSTTRVAASPRLASPGPRLGAAERANMPSGRLPGRMSSEDRPVVATGLPPLPQRTVASPRVAEVDPYQRSSEGAHPSSTSNDHSARPTASYAPARTEIMSTGRGLY